MIHYVYLIIIVIVLSVSIYKYKKLKKGILPTQINEILSEIINLSFNKSNIIDTTREIISVIIDKFDVDYCTIFKKNKRGLSVISTNSKVNKESVERLEEYINDIYNEAITENVNAKILCSENNLDYPTAEIKDIKYFYFIVLENVESNDYRNIIGALLIEDKHKKSMELIEKNMFKLIINTITIVFQDLIYKDKLSIIALTDGLTGLLNRTAMKRQLEEQLKLHNGLKLPFSIALLDIDHFKNINDKYGHIAGDKCLINIANYIKENVRDIDKCYRYGGEEILIFFSRTNNENIKDKVEKMRVGLSNLKTIDNENVINVTVSFGLSEYPDDSIDINKLIEMADKSLYYSKNTGRNKVTFYKELTS